MSFPFFHKKTRITSFSKIHQQKSNLALVMPISYYFHKSCRFSTLKNKNKNTKKLQNSTEKNENHPPVCECMVSDAYPALPSTIAQVVKNAEKTQHVQGTILK